MIIICLILVTTAGLSATPIFSTTAGETSDTTNTNQAINIPELQGVNYYDPILLKTELGLPQYLEDSVNSWPSAKVSLTQMHDHGFKLVRVPFFWEAYLNDKEGVLAEMQAIASAADRVDLHVFFDSHQYKTSSYFYGNPSAGGFPSILMSQYVKNGGASAEKAFWSDYYRNSITVKGIKSWQLQAEMFRSIIHRVDKYNSVLGYEILNEPPIYDNSQYKKLGAMHSFIANKIRSYGSDKFIIFDRAYPVWDSSYIDWNYYSKIAPSNKAKTIFAPHRYSQYYPGIFENYQKLSTLWGDIPVVIGEWAEGSQDAMNDYVKELKKVGFGSTYWSWIPCPKNQPDPQCLLKYNHTPNQYLQYLTKAVNKYYP
jgi:aryl-phospho-beta-D-glucosidase BglC (GH1 family)